jgi:hypothetical protein
MKRLHKITRQQIPHSNQSIPGAGKQQITVRTEVHGTNVSLMTGQHANAFAGNGVPEADTSIKSPRGRPLLVLSPRDGSDRFRMAVQSMEAVSRFDIPDVHRRLDPITTGK